MEFSHNNQSDRLRHDATHHDALLLDSVLDVLAPSAGRLARIIAADDIDIDTKKSIVNKAFLQAASTGNVDLLEWLLQRPGNPSTSRLDRQPLTYFDIDACDQDGCPAIIAATAFGYSEAARVLIEAGANKNATDARGWTALMWAFQSGDLPLCSLLINRQASVTARSHAGLSAIDLIRPGPAGDVFRDALEELAQQEIAGIDEADLSLNKADFFTAAHGEEGRAGDDILSLESQRPRFNWSSCLHEDMLSFTRADLPALLELATNILPANEGETRFLPANILFLASRFAAVYGGGDLLSDLLAAAFDRIEGLVQKANNELEMLAYWLSNCLLLLHNLRKDKHTAQSSEEHHDSLEALIQQLVVLYIREIERKIDPLLESAMLQHSTLSGAEDIRFEGEWRIVKALTSRHKTYSSMNHSTPPRRRSLMGLFESPQVDATPGQIGKSQSSRNLQTPLSPERDSPRKLQRIRTPSVPMALNALATAPPHTNLAAASELSPQHITDILSIALTVLQAYDLAGHPFIVIQAFSQLLYWLGSELFNRLISKKRYLCRSRAVQIRLAVSFLEDWARTARLPVMMLQAHLRPLKDLLHWLQCLSSENDIDGLLGTIQTVKSLNPCQLRKCALDYRYEVEESHMKEECLQYLSQLQKDWEQQIMLAALAPGDEDGNMSHATSSSLSLDNSSTSTCDEEHSDDSSRTSDQRGLDPDAVCGKTNETIDYAAYEPPQLPSAPADLLDSRYMLSFDLPASNESLGCFPAYLFGEMAHFTAGDPASSLVMSARSSIDSLTPTLCFTASDPILPDDFLYRFSLLNMYLGAPTTLASRMKDGTDDHWLNWRARLADDQRSHVVDSY